tara:strand:+ start:1120 stop:1461 length:342 start_codon:yes stop_codon:yes gene_type:complete
MRIDLLKAVVTRLRNTADELSFDYDKLVNDWIFSVEVEYQKYYGLKEDDWGFVENDEDVLDDILQCDTCKVHGSFYGDDLPQLYSMIDWEDGMYCDDCIPEWWAEKLESEESK